VLISRVATFSFVKYTKVGRNAIHICQIIKYRIDVTCKKNFNFKTSQNVPSLWLMVWKYRCYVSNNPADFGTFPYIDYSRKTFSFWIEGRAKSGRRKKMLKVFSMHSISRDSNVKKWSKFFNFTRFEYKLDFWSPIF
jgi:hypothetical protein